MKRRCSIFLLSLVVCAGALRSEICSLDTVPAATLLLPYFDVDLADPQGRTTLMSIGNATDRATLVQVTLWTDAGLPTLNFNVYLTGYDIQTLNLRDLLQGKLPGTADPSRDPGDVLSPRGPESQDTQLPQCETFLPYPAEISPTIVDFFQKAHLGQPSPFHDGLCLGFPTDGRRARGFATVDVVRRCSFLFPTDEGYFGPDGVIGHDNVLWGELFYVDPGEQYAQGENLVRIEADPAAFGPGDTTFYGRYVSYSGADGREPLATTWATRFLRGGAFSGGTDLVVWRDPGRPAEMFACGSEPSWQPLREGRVTFSDEEEYLGSLFLPPAPPNFGRPFAFAAGKVNVESLLTSYDFGWIFLDLGPRKQEAARAQSWVGTVFTAEGTFSAGLKATALDSTCAPNPCLSGASQGGLCVGDGL